MLVLCPNPGTHRIHNGHLQVPLQRPGRIRWESFAIATPSAALQGAYTEMLQSTALPCAPRLFVLRTAGGFGGFHNAGFVAIGLDDARALAIKLLTDPSRAADSVMRRIFRELGEHVVSADRILAETMTRAEIRTAAHEIGHALDRAFPGSTPYNASELVADYYAGRLDAARGADCEIGILFFHAIGCTGDECTHPRPEQRAEAYGRGYADQVRHAQSARYAGF